jgi:hypothetical protein
MQTECLVESWRRLASARFGSVDRAVAFIINIERNGSSSSHAAKIAQICGQARPLDEELVTGDTAEQKHQAPACLTGCE